MELRRRSSLHRTLMVCCNFKSSRVPTAPLMLRAHISFVTMFRQSKADIADDLTSIWPQKYPNQLTKNPTRS